MLEHALKSNNSQLQVPDIIVHLEAGNPYLINRVKNQRNKIEEEQVENTFLTSLNNYYVDYKNVLSEYLNEEFNNRTVSINSEG